MTFSFFLLGVLHTLLPGHWLPLAVLFGTSFFSKRSPYAFFFLAVILHGIFTFIWAYFLGVMDIRFLHFFKYFPIMSLLILEMLAGYYFIRFFFHRVNFFYSRKTKKELGEKNWKLSYVGILLFMIFSPRLDVLLFMNSSNPEVFNDKLLAMVLLYLFITSVTMFALMLLAYRGVSFLKTSAWKGGVDLSLGLSFGLVGLLHYLGDMSIR